MRFHFQIKPVWATHVPTIHSSTMMKKGSQFTRFFSQEMRKLETTGNLDLLRRRYTGSKTCSKPPLKEKPLGYEKLSFLFVMLIFGCMVSIFVFFFERMTQTKKKELAYNVKEMSLMEEKMGDYLKGLSNQENRKCLGRLFLKHYRKKTEDNDTKLDIITSDDFIFNIELDLKKCSCKIPRVMKHRKSI